MRPNHVESVSHSTIKRRTWRHLLGKVLLLATLSGTTVALVGVGAASAAPALTISSQSPTAIVPTGTATYSSIVWSGGTPGLSVELTSSSGLPSGANFGDTDGCATETGSGAGSGTYTFTQASVTTSSGVAIGTYSFTITATEFAGPGCTGAPNTATGNASLIVKYSPSITVTGPSTGVAGTAISNSLIASTLASGSTSPADSGMITFTAFGPQTSAPSVCTSGGTIFGTATVAGNGVYTSNLGYTPPFVGDYWWYASYSGDASDSGTNSTCGAGMSEMIVGPGAPAVTWATPSAITYGTQLTATQLDATAPVAGTFTYTPAIGATLGAGNSTLSVVFTPSDLIDYTSATGTVSLTVSPATLQITASSTTMGYGAAPPSVAASFSGFVNGDTPSSLTTQPTCTTTTISSTAVGTDAGANTCSGAVDANYSINYVPGNVTIVAPALKSNFTSLTIKSGKKTTLSLTCSSATCKGTIFITYRPGTRVLGEKSYSIPAGQSATETILLNSAGRNKLATASKTHSLRAVVKITLIAGSTSEKTIKVT